STPAGEPGRRDGSRASPPRRPRARRRTPRRTATRGGTAKAARVASLVPTRESRGEHSAPSPSRPCFRRGSGAPCFGWVARRLAAREHPGAGRLLVPLAQVVVEHALAEPDRLRRHLDELVVVDELERLLERQLLRRREE